MVNLGTPVIEQLTNESGICAGFPADAYDRYVLGLLDSTERANVDRELHRQCPACLGGVQRSINLWLVFAGSLEQVEPAADFRARLMRIAELSKRMLTVPTHQKQRGPAILVSSLVVICLIIGLLLFVTFLAGQQSSRSELKKVKGELSSLQEESVERQLAVEGTRDGAGGLKTSLNQPAAEAASAAKLLTEQLARAQAESQSYKDSLERDRIRTSQNSTLVAALDSPNVRLLNFRTPEGEASEAYAFVIDNSKVLLVASHLPPSKDDWRYQLWLIQKTDHRAVSLGLFNVQQDVQRVFSFDPGKDALSELAGLSITQEGINGSAEPSASKVLETSIPVTPVTPAADAGEPNR